jgi:hypothetical protein
MSTELVAVLVLFVLRFGLPLAVLLALGSRFAPARPTTPVA